MGGSELGKTWQRVARKSERNIAQTPIDIDLKPLTVSEFGFE